MKVLGRRSARPLRWTRSSPRSGRGQRRIGSREWIVGASYDSTLAPDGRFDARWLDEAVADRPVVLRAWDYHTAWCNSLSLERAGITARTPDPEDGIIARRPDGSPLGTLIESGATNRVLDLIPPTTVATAVEELRRSTAFAASCGITWVQDAWVEAGDIEAWVSAAHQGVLAVDADLAIRADPTRWAEQRAELITLRERIDQAPGITCRTLKFFIDGTIGNHTAYLLENYADSCTRGLPMWRADRLLAAFVDADRLGFDLHLHAIGDGAIRLALDTVQNLRSITRGSDQRVTVAHAQLIDQVDIERFAALDVTVCFQPLWAAKDAVMRELTCPDSARAARCSIGCGACWTPVPDEFRQRLAGDQPERPGRHPHRGHATDARWAARGWLAAGGADHRHRGSHRRHARRRLSGACGGVPRAPRARRAGGHGLAVRRSPGGTSGGAGQDRGTGHLAPRPTDPLTGPGARDRQSCRISASYVGR